MGALFSILTINIASINGNSKRPFINVNAHGQISPWLFDTGAEVCCMSINEFRKIPIDKRPQKLHMHKELRCASSNQLRVKGSFLMTLSVMNREIQQTVHVIENLGQPAILGIDAIEKLGLTYSAKQKQFYFENENWNFKKGNLFALSAHNVPPMTAQPIRVSALESTGFRPPAGVTAVATIHAPHAPSLQGGPGLVTTNQLGEVTVMLYNCAMHEVQVDRGDILGSIECVQGMHLEKVQVNEIAAAFEKLPNARAPNLSEERKREMLKDLNLKVPNNERLKYLELIWQNHDVFSKSKHDLGLANHYEHSISLKNSDPLYIKQFKIPEVHRVMLESQVKEWLKLGIIQRSNSKYNSPVFIVPKKEPGQFRFVQDFRKLNQNSLDDKYCMKDVNECIGDIGRAGSTIFSTLDLTSGFWQMPLDKASRPYTAFTIPGLGQFEWLVSAMGLKSCPSGFQRLVELAMQNLENVIVYIDDLIVHSHTHESHRQTLQQLFDRLRKTGLKVNLKKCQFGSDNVHYLGYRLTPRGILPGVDKLQAVRDAPPPRNVHQVRQFLGLCNFFRSHVRNFSQIAVPLNKLTRKDCVWRGGKLSPEALQAFNELKSALCSEPVVAYPRTNKPYSLIVDAATGNETSEGGVGAILCQQDEKGNYCVIAYASRALVKHEKNYTPFLLEMMAAVWAMEHFDNYLRGRRFVLFTDHRPLEKLATVHKKTLNRLQEAMMEYDFEIRYKSGKEMPADFLSRNVLANIDVFTPDLPQLQSEDEFISNVKNYMLTRQLPADRFKAVHVKRVGHECFLEKDIVWRRLTRHDAQPRTVLLLPQALAAEIVSEAHGQLLTGHNGIAQTKERILQSYYWPNIDLDVALHIQACQKCQSRRKDDRPKPHLLTPLPQCSDNNQRVHVDLFGPLKNSDSGKSYVLVMTDAFSKYAEVVAVPNKEAQTVSLAIFNRWICRFGCPLEIVSDGGKEFVNKVSAEIYKLLGIKHSTTTAYHPQCNAQVERFNQTVAKYLASFTDSTTLDWELYLAPLAFSYNTSLHRVTKATPFSLTFGQEARIPSFPNPDIQRHYGESQPAEMYQRLVQAKHLAAQNSMTASNQAKVGHDKSAVSHNYQTGQLVWLHEENFLGKNRKISPQWTGPYRISKVFTFGVVDIEYKNKIYRVNVGRIKPYVAPRNNTVAYPNMQLPPPSQQPQAQQPQQQVQQTRFVPLPVQRVERQINMEQMQPTMQEESQVGQDMQPPRRGRGRPRKQTVALPPTTPTELQLQENQEGAPTHLQERRVTRQMVREGAGTLTEGQVQAVQQPNILQWRQAVGEGPSFQCNQYGLPIPPQGVRLPQWILDRQRRLKQLSAARRNKILTGDQGYPFDNVAYDNSRGLEIAQQNPEGDDDDVILPAPPEEHPAQPQNPTPPRVPSPPLPQPPTPEDLRQQRQQQIRELLRTSPATTRTGKTFRTPPAPGTTTTWMTTRTAAATTRSRSPSALSSQSGSSPSLADRAKGILKAITRVPPPPGAMTTTTTTGGATAEQQTTSTFSSRGRERFPTLKAAEEAQRRQEAQLRRQKREEQRAQLQRLQNPTEGMTPEEAAEWERRQSAPSTKMSRSP